jgi:hypothetical protein
LEIRAKKVTTEILSVLPQKIVFRNFPQFIARKLEKLVS